MMPHRYALNQAAGNLAAMHISREPIEVLRRKFHLNVLGKLKRQWLAFRGGTPGHRFQDRFDRQRRARKTQSWALRLIQPIIAIILLVIGVVLTFIPGPAIVFYFAGAGLLAGESRTLSRALDWSEVKLRKACRWFKQWWKGASLGARLAVIAMGVCGVIGLAYAAYELFLKN